MSNLENVEKLIGGVVMSFIWHKANCLMSQGQGIGPAFIDEITSPSTIRNLSVAIIKQQEKISKLKDPNAPKKPLSSYLFFCKEKRPLFKSQNPEMKSVDISRLMGAEWRQLSEKKKKKYISKAEEDKIRYLEEMKSYERPSDEELVSRKKSSYKEEKTAYMLFCRDKRSEVKKQNPEMTSEEIDSELETLWEEEGRQQWIIECYINKKIGRLVLTDESEDLLIEDDLIVESNPNKKFSKNISSSETD